ncbi:hypothetical protein, partial [Longicatena caecimuris]|uniref:hypothetical protein n=1 Tax=Longicatena caecimuris TaxID=1796635 RepID=UPI001A9DC579
RNSIEKDDLSYDKSSITGFIYFTCLLDREQIRSNSIPFLMFVTMLPKVFTKQQELRYLC